MATRARWCDRMAAAAAGETPNVCDGYATEKVLYTWPGLGTCVGFYCESCAKTAAYAAAVPTVETAGVCGGCACELFAVPCPSCGWPVAS